jgi:hypothetical protein
LIIVNVKITIGEMEKAMIMIPIQGKRKRKMIKIQNQQYQILFNNKENLKKEE